MPDNSAWPTRRPLVLQTRSRDVRSRAAATAAVGQLLQRHRLELASPDFDSLVHAFRCYASGTATRRATDSQLGPQKQARRAFERTLRHVDGLLNLQENPKRHDRQRTQIEQRGIKLLDALNASTYLAVALSLRGVDWSRITDDLSNGDSLSTDTLRDLRDNIQAELSSRKGDAGRNPSISRDRFLKTLLITFRRTTGLAAAYNWDSGGPKGAFLSFASDAFLLAGTPMSATTLKQAIDKIRHDCT